MEGQSKFFLFLPVDEIFTCLLLLDEPSISIFHLSAIKRGIDRSHNNELCSLLRISNGGCEFVSRYELNWQWWWWLNVNFFFASSTRESDRSTLNCRSSDQQSLLFFIAIYIVKSCCAWAIINFNGIIIPAILQPLFVCHQPAKKWSGTNLMKVKK